MNEQELHLNPEVASDMAAASVLHYADGLGLSPEEKRTWVDGVFDKVRSKMEPRTSVN